jgi:hypothetical protein
MGRSDYKPEAFFSDSPPERYMGTECEYDIQHDLHAEDMNSLAHRYITEQALAQQGIKKVSKMLSNGGGVYPDLGNIEYDSAEGQGLKEATATDLAGILINAEMVRCSGVPHRGLYRHTGSFVKKHRDGHVVGVGSTSGYHESYMFPRKLSQSQWLDRILPSLLASRVWAWVPTLKNGIELSQKVSGIGGKPIARQVARRTTHGSKPMIMIPPVDKDTDIIGDKEFARLEVRFADAGQAPLGRYMSHGETSTFLRVLEHTDKVDLRKLSKLELKDPVSAAKTFSSDLSLTATAETADGRDVTALDVQEDYSKIIEDLGGVVELPPSERPVARLLAGMVDKLRLADPENVDWRGLDRLIDLAAKATYLMMNVPPENLRFDNDEAMAHNLLWDRVFPTGAAQLWWDAYPTKLISKQDIQERVTTAPPGRAANRADFINTTRASGIYYINFAYGVSTDNVRHYFSL